MVLPAIHTISLILHVGFWISGLLRKSLVQMYSRINLVYMSKESCLHVLGDKQKGLVDTAFLRIPHRHFLWH